MRPRNGRYMRHDNEGKHWRKRDATRHWRSRKRSMDRQLARQAKLLGFVSVK